MARHGIKESGRDNLFNGVIAGSRGRCAHLHSRNPARSTQQLVLPLAPLVQSRRIDGIATQVQKHFSALAEALTGKGAGSVRNARAVGKELSARRLTRVISEKLDL